MALLNGLFERGFTGIEQYSLNTRRKHLLNNWPVVCMNRTCWLFLLAILTIPEKRRRSKVKPGLQDETHQTSVVNKK